VPRVLVVGSGGAGLSAALEAVRAGADVTVIEASDRIGGATARAGGVVYAAGTKVQQAAGIQDDVDELVGYYMSVSHHQLEPRLLRASAEGTREVIEWLAELGISWDPARLYVAGLEMRPRGHLPSGDTGGLGPAGGAAIVNALLQAVTTAAVEIRTNTPASRLLRDDSGSIVGVETDAGERLAADAVVLATGGFGASAEMIARYWPDAAQHADWQWYLGPDSNVGHGITMALEVGGVVIDENSGVLMETPNFGRINEGFTPPWLVFVNTDGRRFINEMDTYCVLGYSINQQPGAHCYAIFDEAALLRAEADEENSSVDPYGLGVEMASNWTGSMLRKQIADGRVQHRDTLDELAAAAGIAAPALATAVDEWNADVEVGRDTAFEKPPTLMLPIATPPFYAVEIRPAIVGMTFTGIRADHEARVLDTAGRAIPGLFAAGELTGGLQGRVYFGGGTSIGNAVAFGRIAGRRAAGR
jgi:fumarate reductase flavoprotein subunit